MSEFEVGSTVKVRFGVGNRQQVRLATVLAHKSPTSKEILIQATDGSIIATAIPVPVDQDGVKLKVDAMCPIGNQAYTREKAFKTLGYKNHLR